VENDRGVTVRARPSMHPIGADVAVAVKVGNTTLKLDEGFFLGRVERVLYEGVTIHVDVMAEGQRYSAKLPNRKFEEYGTGDEVTVGWPPSEATVFALPPEGLEEELRLD